jgi:hypothetical protein
MSIHYRQLFVRGMGPTAKPMPQDFRNARQIEG